MNFKFVASCHIFKVSILTWCSKGWGWKSAFPLSLRKVGFKPSETIRFCFYLRKITQELVRNLWLEVVVD